MIPHTLSQKHLLLASALFAAPILFYPSTSSALSFESIDEKGVTATIENGVPLRFEQFRNALVFVDTNNNILFSCVSSSREDLTFSVSYMKGKSPIKPFWVVKTMSKEKEPRVIDYWLVGTDSKGVWANFLSEKSLSDMNVSLGKPKGNFSEEIVDGSLHIIHTTDGKPDTSFYARWDDKADWLGLSATLEQLPSDTINEDNDVTLSDTKVDEESSVTKEEKKNGIINGVVKANVMVFEQIWGFFSGLFNQGKQSAT